MDKDRVGGSAKQIKRTIKELVGQATGDAKLESEGKADKVEGKIQNAVGGIPALIHYPRDFLMSAPAMTIATARRWGRRLARPFDHYGRRAIVPGQAPVLHGLPSLSEAPGSDARNSTP